MNNQESIHDLQPKTFLKNIVIRASWFVSAMAIISCHLTSGIYAAPTNDTNIAREISFSITSTFENTGGLFDGVVDSTPKFSALTGDISKFIQQVIVPLKNPAYLREIKVFWDKEAYTLDYNIQYSRDGRKWFNLKRTKIEEEQNSFVHFFDGISSTC